MPLGAKYGGRTKGTKNKYSLGQKKWMVAFLEENQPKLKTEMNKMKGNDFVYAYLKMCSIVLPKPTEEAKQADKTNPTIIKLADGTEITV